MHYHDAPIAILDDCFSALDVDTERNLIRDLIKGSWNNKTRLIATHRLSLLPETDNIIFLSNGQIEATGPFWKLLKDNLKFKEFVKSLEAKEASHE